MLHSPVEAGGRLRHPTRVRLPAAVALVVHAVLEVPLRSEAGQGFRGAVVRAVLEVREVRRRCSLGQQVFEARIVRRNCERRHRTYNSSLLGRVRQYRQTI